MTNPPRSKNARAQAGATGRKAQLWLAAGAAALLLCGCEPIETQTTASKDHIQKLLSELLQQTSELQQKVAAERHVSTDGTPLPGSGEAYQVNTLADTVTTTATEIPHSHFSIDDLGAQSYQQGGGEQPYVSRSHVHVIPNYSDTYIRDSNNNYVFVYSNNYGSRNSYRSYQPAPRQVPVTAAPQYRRAQAISRAPTARR